MNLMQLAPLWLSAIFCGALIAAALEDAIRLRVSNLTVLAVIATAVTALALNGWSSAIWENLVIFALLLIGGTFLFATGKFGGGDVKLLAALGLWFDLEGALWLLVYVFIAGGLLTVVILSARLFAAEHPRIAILKRGSGIPYGIAIAIGALIAISTLRLG